jgi:hypothetical protein
VDVTSRKPVAREAARSENALREHPVGVLTTAAMRIHVDEPDLVEPLLDFFAQRVGCVAAPVADDEIEVSLLGSLSLDAHRLALERLVKASKTAHPGARATVRPHPSSARTSESN